MSDSIKTFCNNCLFDFKTIDMTKVKKCPRCSCGIINSLNIEETRDVPNDGGNSPDVRGKPLAS